MSRGNVFYRIELFCHWKLCARARGVRCVFNQMNIKELPNGNGTKRMHSRLNLFPNGVSKHWTRKLCVVKALCRISIWMCAQLKYTFHSRCLWDLFTCRYAVRRIQVCAFNGPFLSLRPFALTHEISYHFHRGHGVHVPIIHFITQRRYMKTLHRGEQ